jgi:hypothetical protein
MSDKFRESVCTCGNLMRQATIEEIRGSYEPDLASIPEESRDNIWICSCGKTYYVSEHVVKGSDINIYSTQGVKLEELDKADGKERKEWR